MSVSRYGGTVDDYADIHQFIDSTKNLCSDNRHRIFHNLWAVNEIVIPIFGHTLINSDGKQIDIKDMCEKDHLLPDFQGRFIPTLGDFVLAMKADLSDEQRTVLENFHAEFISSTSCEEMELYQRQQISRLMLSPLAITGQLKSLLITHNSWFVNDILPRLGLSSPIFIDFDINASDIFATMDFELWMDNGADYPPSAKNLRKLKGYQQI